MTITRTLLGAMAVAVLGVAVAAPARAAAATAGLWHMDDTGSLMTDSSGNGNNGTLKNVDTAQPGLFGSSFGFNGAPSVVTVSDSPSLDPGTASFTVSVSLKFSVLPSSLVGDYDLVRKGLAGAAGGDWKLEIRPTGKAYCTFRGTSRLALIAGPDLSDNSWHQITCGRTATGIVLTVDGVAHPKLGPTGPMNNTSPLSLGAKSETGGDQYNGQLDEVSLSVG